MAQTLDYHDALVAALRAGDAAATTRIRRDDLQSLADFIRARRSDG